MLFSVIRENLTKPHDKKASSRRASPQTAHIDTKTPQPQLEHAKKLSLYKQNDHNGYNNICSNSVVFNDHSIIQPMNLVSLTSLLQVTGFSDP